MNNQLVLQGSILGSPLHRQSPSGIPHCNFWIEHRSTQIEAGVQREVYCRLPVVASGHDLYKQTHYLVQGVQIEVSGFLCYQQSRSGLEKNILHALKINKI